MCSTITARSLRAGMRYIGRRQWHITVERITHRTDGKVTIEGIDGFGVPHKEIRHRSEVVELV